MRTTCEIPRVIVDITKGATLQVTEPDGLLWAPEVGIGWLPSYTPEIYGLSYWAKYLAMDATRMGVELTARRHAFVRKHCPDEPLVDFGIGGGAFLKHCWAQNGLAWGFDINPQAIDWLQQHHRWVDPYSCRMAALTCWDSLEHVPDPERLLANVEGWLFVSMPIVAAGGEPTPDWRHYRPGEHLLYATNLGLVRLLESLGFEMADRQLFETELGRLDIETFAFRRRA